LSTEQILHPEKYFNYERPIKIILPDVTSLLNAGNKPQSTFSNQPSAVSTPHNTRTAGVSPAAVAKASSHRRRLPNRSLPTTPPPPPASWRRIDSDVSGEWSYYLILDQFLNAQVESKRAAAGWAGDRYALYEGPNGQVLLAQLTAWDTENDAREFFDAYVKRTELRYRAAKPLNSADADGQTQNSKLETRNSYSWETSEGRVTIELRGLRVLILEGVPEAVDSKTLLKTLW
jgi:hypothetical protein